MHARYAALQGAFLLAKFTIRSRRSNRFTSWDFPLGAEYVYPHRDRWQFITEKFYTKFKLSIKWCHLRRYCLEVLPCQIFQAHFAQPYSPEFHVDLFLVGTFIIHITNRYENIVKHNRLDIDSFPIKRSVSI